MQQSRAAHEALDCFAEPVIGPRFARTRRLAITAKGRGISSHRAPDLLADLG